MWVTRRARWAPLAAVACCLLVAGCSADVIAGRASPAPATAAGPAATLPYTGSDAEQARLYAQMRKVDVCALHDPEAAATVTGDAPSQLAPYLGLNDCRLVLTRDAGSVVETWQLRITLSEYASRAAGRDGIVAESIGGAEVFRDTDMVSERRCSYLFPLAGFGGFELQVAGPAPADRKKKPCAVAAEYLAAVLPIWQDPPQRSDGRTRPQLGLAELDACVLATEVLPMVATQGAGTATEDGSGLMPDGPYTCEAMGPGGFTGPTVDVELTMDASPTETIGEGDQPIRIAGRPGWLSPVQTDPPTCDVAFQASDLVLPRGQQTHPYVEVIAINAPSCEMAKTAAVTIAKKVGS